MENGTISLYQQQKKEKPKIEGVIEQNLSGKQKQMALDFLGFLKTLRSTPSWASANSWAVNYKGKRVCYIKVGNGTWYIRPSIGYNEATAEFCRANQLEQIMLKHVHFCGACGRCAPGKNVVFWGQKIEHMCHNIDFEFHNPDKEALQCAKQLVLFRRESIAKIEKS